MHKSLHVNYKPPGWKQYQTTNLHDVKKSFTQTVLKNLQVEQSKNNLNGFKVPK